MKLAIVILASLTATVVSADPPTCPAAVQAAIDKAFPKARISGCRAEREHGRDQFEVKLAKEDGARVEADVTPDGQIIQLEEDVAIDRIPTAVMKAFAAKYGKAKVTSAEKQTPAHGAPSYELAFSSGKGRKEATFSEDGRFIEEE